MVVEPRIPRLQPWGVSTLDNEELLLDKSERAELLELVLELRKFRDLQDEEYDDFLNDREREC